MRAIGLYFAALILVSLAPWATAQIPKAYVSAPNPPGMYALVVSVERYKHLPRVLNATNDALHVAGAMQKAGFTTIRYLSDPDHVDEIINAIRSLVREANAETEPAVLVLYFAGHGFSCPELDLI